MLIPHVFSGMFPIKSFAFYGEIQPESLSKGRVYHPIKKRK